MKTTFSISFYCRESKQNKQGLSPLELCININQQRLFINLPSKFNSKDFNKKRKPNYIEELLNTYRIKVNEVVNSMMIEGLPITAQAVREWLRTGGIKSKTIQNLCEEYLEHIKIRVGTSLTPAVYKKYSLVCDFLMEQLTPSKEITTITNADCMHLYDVLKQKFLLSTSAGYMTRIKTILTFAVDNGYMKNNPSNSIKISKGNPTVSYLTSEEINRLKTLNLTDYAKLDRIRDLLLFQASTGLAYCDLRLFDATKIIISNNVATYTQNRQKTGIEFTTVLLPNALYVLEKYNNTLPIISNQKYNRYLKELQVLAGIKTTLTTHLMRKTYAHLMLNNGVRIETVARLLGHSNSLITQKIYCRKTTDTIAQEVAQVFSFNPS